VTARAIDMLIRTVVETLPRYRYRFADEKALHDGIAEALTGAGLAFERESVAGPRDRFDFLLPDGVVIEVKVDGSAGDAVRQVARYCARDDVSAVVLATTKGWQVPSCLELHGKPIRVINLKGASF
jgi:hypothetical protein